MAMNKSIGRTLAHIDAVATVPFAFTTEITRLFQHPQDFSTPIQLLPVVTENYFRVAHHRRVTRPINTSAFLGTKSGSITSGLPVIRQVGSGLFPGDIGIALHVELAIIFMCDSEAESLVEPPSGIDPDNIQAHCKIELIGFANQSLHHLCADASALKRAIHKHLCDKEPIILRDGLQPAYIRTVEGYHTDLRRVPLLPEAGFLSGSIQM